MIKLIADSTCDLSDEMIERYNIGIAPLAISIEGVTYSDRVDITSDDFLARIASLKSNPTTGMPSPSKFLELYEEAYDSGLKEIICITMSSGTSGSYQSAVIAEGMLKDKYPERTDYKLSVIDSYSMSHGSGTMVLKSAMLAEEGKTFEEIVEFNIDTRLNVKHFLSVDDLDNLIRSGRLSSTSALMGKMLRLKPIMTMQDKKGAIESKERGRKKVLSYYIKYFNERANLELTSFIIVGYTSDVLYAKNLESKIKLETDFKGEIYIMQMGVAVSNHVGLGGVSMYFYEKKKEKSKITPDISSLNEKRKEFTHDRKEDMSSLNEKRKEFTHDRKEDMTSLNEKRKEFIKNLKKD